MIEFNFKHLPIAPNTLVFINQSKYVADLSEKPQEDEYQKFSEYVISFLDENPIENQKQFINLVEEWTTMRCPDIALYAVEKFPDFFDETDFRLHLAVGVAQMLQGSFEKAIENLQQAHLIEKEEISPPVNLAQIYTQLVDQDLAVQWVKRGLEVDPLYPKLWELLGQNLYQKNQETYLDDLKKWVDHFDSWLGHSYYSELVNADNQQLKLECLQPYYDKGLRSQAFLIELTACLGACKEFNKIRSILKEFKESGAEFPWQLKFHDLQASMGLEDLVKAREQLSVLKDDKALPTQVSEYLEDLNKEINEST